MTSVTAPSAPADSRFDERVERAFGNRNGFFIVALLAAVGFFDFWDSVAIAVVAPALLKEWELPFSLIGFMIAVGYAGQFAGAFLFGWLADRFGRKPMFLLAAGWMTVLSAVCALAPNLDWMVVARFVQGIGVGGAIPIAATYINEIMPARTRGRNLTLFTTVATSGIFACSALAVVIVPTIGWRWVFAVGLVPLLILPVLAWKMPESPRWLLKIGRTAQAKAVLDRLDPAGASESLVDVTLEGRQANLRDLFANGVWRTTVVIWPVWFLTSFMQYALITWLPSIYVSVYGFEVKDALAYSAIPHFTYLIVALITASIIDRVGRRRIAIFGMTVAATIFTLLLFIPHPDLVTLITLTTIGSNSVAMGFLVLWAYTGEVYQTRLRAVGVGIASSFARAASMATPAVVGVILHTTGQVEVIFAVMAAAGAVVVVLWLFFSRETKGLKLD